jgi:CRP-like cAMP-binding protein
LVDKTSELGVVYKLRYWITPWKKISPSTSRDEMHSKILKHLWHAGITPAYPKEDVYYAKMPSRHLDDDLLEDRIALMSKVKLLSVLTNEEKQYLAEKMIRRKFKSNESIVQIGQNGDSMYLLLEGLLGVYVKDHHDNEVKVSELSPSDYFGEMSLLTGENRSASVLATTDSVVFEITKESFNKVLQSRKELINSIVAKMKERKVMNNQTLEIMESTDQDINIEYERKLIDRIKAFFGLK